MTTRERAYRILEAIDVEGAYSHIALNKSLADGINKQDADFVRHLVFGVLEKRGLLDDVIKEYCDKGTKRKVRQLLRLALYQLIFMDRVPSHAVVHETVDLCKKVAPQHTGFVNAFLRRVDIEAVRTKDYSDLPTLQRLSIVYSVPEWLNARWLARYGEMVTEQMLQALRHKSKLYMRLNPLKGDFESLKAQLTARGLTLSTTPFEELVEVTEVGPVALHQFDLLQEGKVSVQDLAAFLVGKCLPLTGAVRLLDACAAPGGKSGHLAERYPDATVISTDIYPAKVKAMDVTFAKRGYKNVQCLVHDARELEADWLESFDAVILDAPCSGLGIIRRKPELVYHKVESDIAALAELQHTLLQVQAQYVKPGGYLLYATCTIEPDENEDQVRRFLMEHPNFKVVSLRDQLPENVVGPDGFVSLLPSEAHDGFFIALLNKENEVKS